MKTKDLQRIDQIVKKKLDICEKVCYYNSINNEEYKMIKKVIFQTDETRIKKVSYITPDGNKVSRYAEVKNGKIVRLLKGKPKNV